MRVLPQHSENLQKYVAMLVKERKSKGMTEQGALGK